MRDNARILQAGTRLGPYEIVSQLGAGGMGEVYRARDPRIAREVAIKVLPPAFAENADRVRRFEQESRATGAVSHPNLLTIFDVGTQDGIPYIVSELLEGATLRDRLHQALAPKRAVEYATQIARGVGAAHEKGIVHRDLKPDNIFITNDERVKLLDFGLAKLLQAGDGAGGADASQATAARQNTSEGAVLGTVSYMSPEQVHGQPVDARSDVFSFGAVLYEMLTGVRPFRGDSNVATMAAIINDDPVPMPSSTHAALERIVMHAMEKLPANRFQSMKDVVFALETFSGSGETTAVPAKSKSSRSKPAAKKPELVLHPRFQRITFRRGFVMTARFMADGSVVYGAAWEGNETEVFTVTPGNPESRSAGFPSADVLAISSSGELALSLGRHSLGGWATSGTLAQSPLFGAPRELADDVQDADWMPDGMNIAALRHTARGYTVEVPVGNEVYVSQAWISNVRVSPRGDRIAVLEHDLWGDDGGRVVILDLDGKRVAQSRVWSSTGGLAWTPAGDEVWTGGESDRSTRDIWALSLNGKERIVMTAAGRLTLHDISREGRALIGLENGRREIIAGTRGGVERNVSWLDWSFPGAMSDDGTRVAFEEQAGGRRPGAASNSVYVRNIDGSAAVRLGEGRVRAISPDGGFVVIWHPANDYLDVVPVRIGKGRHVPLHGWKPTWWDWTMDGKQIVGWGTPPEGGAQHFIVAIDGGAAPRAVTPEGTKGYFAVSPDAKELLAPAADNRLMIFPVDGGEPRPMPSAEPDDRPVQWSRDGGSVYVSRPARTEAAIDRIELATGARSRSHVLHPDDAAGIMDIYPVLMTRDGEKYAYSYRRFLSDLYVIDGLA